MINLTHFSPIGRVFTFFLEILKEKVFILKSGSFKNRYTMSFFEINSWFMIH